MASDGTVIIEITGDDKKLRDTLNSLEHMAGSALKGLTASVAAASATLGGLSVAAAKVGSEFEQTMANTSTMFGDVAVDTEGLNAKVLELSDSTGVAANEIGKSLYNALSAGIPVTEDMAGSMEYMEQCTQLAKAGFTDVDTAVTATAKVMNAYGKGLEDVESIQKIMIQTQNKGITTVDELGATLAQVTPTAAAMGVSFENVGAALSNMTAMGTPTAQATTQLNSLIAELGKSGTFAAKQLEAAAAGSQYAGMNFTEMMDAGVPLNKVLDLMGNYAEENGLSMVDMFSSIEAGKAAMALAGENSRKFTDNLAAMSTEADVVGEAYEKVTDTLQARTEKLTENFKNLGIAVYHDMQKPLSNAADAAIGMVEDLQKAYGKGGLSKVVKEAGKVFADLSVGVASYAPRMVDAGVAFLQSFVDGILKNKGKIFDAAGQIASSLLHGLGNLVPVLAPVTGAVVAIGSHLEILIPTVVGATTAFLVFQAAMNAAAISGMATTIYRTGKELLNLVSILVAGNWATMNYVAATRLGVLAQQALNVVQALSPVVFLAAGTLAVVAAFATYMAMTQKATSESAKLNARVAETTERFEELSGAQEALSDTRSDSVGGVEAEVDAVENYVSELQGLIDANGKVKDGYEMRADYLAEQINKFIPDAVKANKTEEGSIYAINTAIQQQIFEKKKSMLLDAMQPEVTEAYKKMGDAQQVVTDRTTELGKAKQLLADATEKENSATNPYAQMGYATATKEAKDKVEALTLSLEEAKGVVADYQNTLDTVELISYAGSMDELDKATVGLSDTLVSSTGNNKEALEKAFADALLTHQRVATEASNTWKSMSYQQKREYGSQAEYTEKFYGDQLRATKNGLDAQAKESSKGGVEITTSMGDGIASGAYVAMGATKTMFDSMESEAMAAIPGFLTTAELLDFEVANGIKENSGVVTDAAGEVLENSSAAMGAKTSLFVEVGRQAVAGTAKGIENNKALAIAAAQNMALSALEAANRALGIHSPSKEFAQVGAFASEGLAIGMKDGEGKVIQTAAELSKHALEAATDWVSDKKFYHELGAQEELEFWEELKAIAVVNGKELEEVNRNIYTARAEASKESYEQSKKWIDQEKFYNNLSAKEEEEAWTRVAERGNLAIEEQLQAQKELYSAKESASKESFDNSKKWIDNEKFYKRLSAEQEIAALGRVVNRGNLLKAEQLDAEKELYAARQSYAKEQADAEKEIYAEQQQAFEQYQANVEARAESLRNFTGLFSAINKDNKVSGRELLQNLKDQLQTFQQWQADMEKLSAKGLSAALITELQKMGPAAAAEIHALITLTEGQIREYNEAFSALGQGAAEQAAAEIQPVEVPLTVGAISPEEAASTVSGSVSAVCAALEASTAGLTDSTQKLTQSICATAVSNLSPLYSIGVDAMRGLGEGLLEQGREAVESARQIANEIVAGMRGALDIHSPSRKMRDLVGAPTAQGFFVGFESEMARMHQRMQDTVNMEVGKISLNASVQAEERMGRRVAATGPEAAATSGPANEVKVVVGFDVSGNEFTRAMRPYLLKQERLSGSSLVERGV